MNHGDPRTLTFLFEECARRLPGHAALEFEGELLSYGELNRSASRLDHFLRNSGGVRPDDRVAILVRRPPDVVIAMLATLKAGGAYVPLDPDNPPGVTQRIVEDVAPKGVAVEHRAIVNTLMWRNS
ncbi:AMP-binding protein [Streptomyces sp. NBC_01465]|uniref:AMP-binding protein n=1 Tax=Streptomyces sp. NBC_01465 TaxID=2903878 RepID=UPI002E30D136|nr:AMP-binding protein [Streptomyces sp. NBC_01465]